MNAIRLGRHLLEEEIGQGAFGSVFRTAADGETGATEVELLLPELASDEAFVSALKQNAPQTSMIRHDGVVLQREVVVDEGRVGLVLDPAGGVSLRALLRDGPMEPHTTAGILRAILGVFARTHASGAMHLALQPENVHVLGDGNVRISEWGVGKAIRSAWRGRSTPRPGDARYRAPEQQRGIAAPAADLYSAGVLAWEMLSGSEFFPGEEEVGLFLTGTGFPEIRERVRIDCPAWLSAFVESLTRTDPTRRPRGAEAAIRAMDSARGIKAPATGRPPVGMRRGPRGVPDMEVPPSEATFEAPEAPAAEPSSPAVHVEEEPATVGPTGRTPDEDNALTAALNAIRASARVADDDIEAPSAPLSKVGLSRSSARALGIEDVGAPQEEQVVPQGPQPDGTPAGEAGIDAEFDAFAATTLGPEVQAAGLGPDKVPMELPSRRAAAPTTGFGGPMWLLVALAAIVLVIIAGWLLVRKPTSGSVPATVQFETPPTSVVGENAGAPEAPAPTIPGAVGVETAPVRGATAPVPAPAAPNGRVAPVAATGAPRSGPPYPIGTVFNPSPTAPESASRSTGSASPTAAATSATADQLWGPVSGGSSTSAPADANGILSITSNPSGATVVVNGRSIGTTPLSSAALPAGRYDIKLQKDGYHEAGRLVDLSAGQNIVLSNVTLQYAGGSAAPASGSGTAVLKASGSAAGSRVYVDGTLMGTLPVTVLLAQGSHLFKVQSSDGTYYTTRKNVTFDGSGEPVYIDLAP